MQGDFFQVLRRVQKEERNKSSLARVDNDFYKHIRDYIRDLERSVASDPFGNEQLLLNNAQRIATEICELRESKITQAANNNIYRSFLLFKKNNPQFDLLDTTPLNLTPEEETLYFSLMDALKNHRYRISLDEYTEESAIEVNYEEDEDFDEDYDEDEESSFVEDSYESSSSVEEESLVLDDMEDEISDALGESNEVLDRLNQIKNAKVITDETYENIDKQVANQMYPGQDTADNAQEIGEVEESEGVQDIADNVQGIEEAEEVQSTAEEESKNESSVSTDPEDFYKNPDSQFVD
ncbi:MAG: DNA replication complex GINS family protein, partial [Methanobrevibacter sp.]|nr:DNA replication complex GINS family protein [Methanobrevibacter sp.]